MTTTLHGFDVHPAAGIFPLINGDDFQRLVEDIRANGLADEVTLDSDGLLIDGRNRVRACAEAGVEIRTRRFDGDAVQYVVTHNLHRRHLTNRQRAMVGGRLANLPHGTNRFSVETPIGVSTQSPTRSAVKKLLSVSEGSLQRAKVIDREGSPSLIALADDDKVSLSAAAAVAADLDAADQDAFVEQVRAGADPGKIAPKPNRARSKAAAAGPDKSVDGVRVRRERIREMAEQGYSSRQIAKTVGIGDDRVRHIAREQGIDIHADKTMGNTRRVDANRIVNEIVYGLEGTQMAIDLIDYDRLDREQAAHWATSLKESISALTTLRKHIEEMTQ